MIRMMIAKLPGGAVGASAYKVVAGVLGGIKGEADTRVQRVPDRNSSESRLVSEESRDGPAPHQIAATEVRLKSARNAVKKKNGEGWEPSPQSLWVRKEKQMAIEVFLALIC